MLFRLDLIRLSGCNDEIVWLSVSVESNCAEMLFGCLYLVRGKVDGLTSAGQPACAQSG